MDTDASSSVVPVFIHGFLDGAVAWAEVVAIVSIASPTMWLCACVR
jgi:hypothetical protein